MRARIVRLAVLAAVLATVALGLPLAVGAARYYVVEERVDLTTDTEVAAAALASGVDARPPAGVEEVSPGTLTALYDAAGRRVAGDGPAVVEPDLLAALDRSPREAVPATGRDGSYLSLVAIDDDARRVGLLRAARPPTGVQVRTGVTWGAIAVVAALAVGATWLVARRSARRLAAPLEDVAEDARRLGDGDFAVRGAVSGIAEIDAVAASLRTTAGRLAEVVVRERAFSAEASHQLRTPLAGLRLRLEEAAELPAAEVGPALADALVATDRLARTVEDLLRLARDAPGPGTPVRVRPLLDDAVTSAAAALGARPVVIAEEEAGAVVLGSVPALRQILAVLLDNAVVHGRGTVTVTVRAVGDGAVAVDVADEGDLPADGADPFLRPGRGEVERPSRGPGSGHGLGLALARRLTETEGGRLWLRSRAPTAFTLALRAEGDDTGGRPDGTGRD